MARYLQGCLYIDRKIKEGAEQGTRRFPFPPTGGLRGEESVATDTTDDPGQPKPAWHPGLTQEKATKPQDHRSPYTQAPQGTRDPKWA